MKTNIVIPEELFWDIRVPLSYNALFNFIVGMRGGGKTYGGLRWAIGNFLKSPKYNPRQFMYVRRYKTELEKLTQTRNGRLFNAVSAEFVEHELKAESNVLTCDKQVCGYAVPLSTSGTMKSDSFPNVTDIFFDEFIIDSRGSYHYLRDEVGCFLDLYETVARGREVRVWFFGNAISTANPYFEYFNLDMPYNGKIQRFGKHKKMLVQNFSSPGLAEYRKNTSFGKIIADTEYSDYAYDNKMLLDNNDFIEKKSRASFYHMTIIYKNKKIGVWLDDRQGLYFISDDVLEDWERIYCATTADHKPNIMLMRYDKASRPLQLLVKAYECGAVRYETQALKCSFRDIMRFRNL